MTFDYEGWLDTAKDRLEELYRQKNAIENEISVLEDGIKGFAPLVANPPQWLGPDAGITDAVRTVLKGNRDRLFTPTEIRDELLKQGVPLTQRNPLASIHQILARLVNKKTAKIIPYEPGRNRYMWARDEDEKPTQRKGSRK